MIGGGRGRAKKELAYRMARFIRDLDPYGFMDEADTFESMDEALERTAGEMMPLIDGWERGHDVKPEELAAFLLPDDIPEDMMAERDAILNALDELAEGHVPILPKNPFKIKR